jgi:hypothetical protein
MSERLTARNSSLVMVYGSSPRSIKFRCNSGSRTIGTISPLSREIAALGHFAAPAGRRQAVEALRIGARDLDLVAVLLRHGRARHQPLHDNVAVLAVIGHRRHNPLTLLARWQLHAELLEQAQLSEALRKESRSRAVAWVRRNFRHTGGALVARVGRGLHVAVISSRRPKLPRPSLFMSCEIR